MKTFTPKELYKALDQSVSGQHDAKVSLANIAYNGHLKYAAYKHFGYDQLEKVTSLLIGPTGCGKTYLLSKLKEFLGTVMVIQDCSAVTAIGYSKEGGVDLDTLAQDFLKECVREASVMKVYNPDDEDKEEVIRSFKDNVIKVITGSLLVFDEFDKLSENNDGSSRGKYNLQIQDNLLKLIEGKDIELNLDKILSTKLLGTMKINTSLIPMVFLGAFTDLRASLAAKNEVRSIGFVETAEKVDTTITKENVISYGFKEELLGRINTIVTLKQLDRSNLDDILRKKSGNLLAQYKTVFGLHGKTVELTEALVDEALDTAVESKLGARALKEFFISRMGDILFNLPETYAQHVTLDIKDGKIVSDEENSYELDDSGEIYETFIK